MAENEGRAVAPFRHRHDGWTLARQKQFLERLTETGCVSEACRTVELTTTSAYRAYARMPDFAMAWERALATRRPMLEDVAFERALHGATVPLTRLGKVVGERRVFSDGLLRFLIEREDRRDGTFARGSDGQRIARKKPVTAEETDRVLNHRLDLLAKRLRKEQAVEAIGFADRMKKEGKAP